MRRRAVAAAAAVVVAAWLATSASGVLGSKSADATARPAHVVVAGDGSAGLYTMRDGALTRLDIQSPPYRLVVPPPATGPVANALAVGDPRVWIARGQRLYGYIPNETSPLPVWTTQARLSPGRLVLASAGATLWASVAGGREIRAIRVREPRGTSAAILRATPVLRPIVATPEPVVGVAAVTNSAWILMRTPGDGTALGVLGALHHVSAVNLVLTSPRAPLSICALGGLMAVLVRGQVLRVDPFTGHVLQRIGVPPGMRSVSIAPGQVVVSDPTTGEVIDISADTLARTVWRLSPPVRAVVATRGGFWASVGPDATPMRYLGS